MATLRGFALTLGEVPKTFVNFGTSLARSQLDAHSIRVQVERTYSLGDGSQRHREQTLVRKKATRQMSTIVIPPRWNTVLNMLRTLVCTALTVPSWLLERNSLEQRNRLALFRAARYNADRRLLLADTVISSSTTERFAPFHVQADGNHSSAPNELKRSETVTGYLLAVGSTRTCPFSVLVSLSALLFALGISFAPFLPT